jgi:hypothetical protein
MLKKSEDQFIRRTDKDISGKKIPKLTGGKVKRIQSFFGEV